VKWRSAANGDAPDSSNTALPDVAHVALPAEVALPAIPGIAASRHCLTQPVWRC
jgi:hypothetical protein